MKKILLSDEFNNDVFLRNNIPSYMRYNETVEYKIKHKLVFRINLYEHIDLWYDGCISLIKET